MMNAVSSFTANLKKTDRLTHFASEQSLSYLDGTLPGDFGFDPLGLSDPESKGVGFITPSWLAYAEVINGRFAMLGAAGMIAPEILGRAGLGPSVAWFRSGVIPPLGTYTYWTDAQTLFWVMIIAMQFAELRRLQDYRKPGSMGEQYFVGLEKVMGGSGDPAYPGGPWFNILGFGKTDMGRMKLAEIKNARLAMLAVLGYFLQAGLTGKGPFENLLDHMGSGGAVNILSNFSALN